MAQRENGYVERLAAIRQQIAEAKTEAERVAGACVPYEEAEARIAGVVDRVARRWQPQVGEFMVPSGAAVELQAATSDPFVLGGMLAALTRTALVEAIRAELQRRYATIDAASCVALAERPARLATLRQRLFRLECDEERVICDAAR